MNLESLQLRLQEVDRELVNMSNNYQTLLGHKNELLYWISALETECEVETVVDEPIAPEVNPEVE